MTGTHPARLNPPDSFAGFLFRESPLRSLPGWAAFLDALHPSEEHAFFVQAEACGQAGIEVPNGFRREQIITRRGRDLAAHFGHPIAVSVNAQRTYLPLKYD